MNLAETPKSPSVPLYERGKIKSPFAKGDLGGFPLHDHVH